MENNKQMIVLFDIDSLIYSSCYNVDSFEDCTWKFEEIYMSIINTIEETYEIDHINNYGISIGNYRKNINKQYKADRTAEPPKYLSELQNWVLQYYQVIQGLGVETDDMVARQQRILKEDCLIVSIDKDYKQLEGLIYNYHYKHKCYYQITKEEALYNFYEQMIVGDENINYCKGYGKAYAKKIFKESKTKYQYTKQLFKLYKKIHKSKARERYIDCYRMLKLGL